MTRKEKQAAQATAIRALKVSWLEELKKDCLENGTNIMVASDKIKRRVQSDIRNKPQQKEQLVRAWNEFVTCVNNFIAEQLIEMHNEQPKGT